MAHFPAKLIRPSLMFASQFGACLSGAPAYVSRLLALPTYIRLGWKGLPETNFSAYYEHLYIKVKMEQRNSYIFIYYRGRL
jgi:hypothetical protein